MHSQDVYSQRRAQLSADKQALLDRRLHALAHVEIVPEIIPPCPVTDDGLVAASFAQQRLWFLQELEPENVAYNESIAIRMQGPFHLESYTRAYQDLVGRHEVLHSTFALIDGQVIQRIHPVAQNESCVTVIDLTGQSETERDQALQDIISQETQRPFYLSKERPWRTFLLRLAAEEHISLTVMHHIITDGWSMTIFFEELSTLYAAYSAGRTSPLPENITHYSSYAHWQRERLARGDLEKQRVYWQQQMKGPLPILELPQDHTRPAQQTYHGSRFSFQLPPELGQKLTQFGFQEGATLFMVLLSAFEVLLYRYSGQEDIVVGSPVAGRTHPQLESTMGCFVNTLVLRNNLAGNPSFRDLLRQVRKVTLEAFDAQDFPFEKLVEDVQPERDLRRNPIFQTFFVLQNTPPRHVQHDDQLIISRLEIPSTTTKFDLLLNMEETDGKLGGFFEYNTDLFDAGSIERMQGHFRHILETCASNPDQGIATFGLLSRTEYQQQVVEWNATDQPYMLNTCLHHLVEAQVERSPSAEAVRFQQEALTYQELNRRANQLANYLREQGVGPDVCVGIYLERSLEMVVALLGVLKAGGAYVPIDPGYPGERVAFILQNSQVPILLIQEHLRSTLPTYTRQLVALDADWPEIARRSVETPASITGPDHLAYV
ncbi:MAG TPA: condensation domain-containing protein, partial [Ktedonobacteraceae bacterium]|nr:condensation domain-containing protein [Ktedonobacteraceae bacterium]